MYWYGFHTGVSKLIILTTCLTFPYRACREGVVVIDMSFMSKFLVSGRDAGACLNRWHSIQTDTMRVKYTYALNDHPMKFKSFSAAYMCLNRATIPNVYVYVINPITWMNLVDFCCLNKFLKFTRCNKPIRLSTANVNPDLPLHMGASGVITYTQVTHGRLPADTIWLTTSAC